MLQEPGGAAPGSCEKGFGATEPFVWLNLRQKQHRDGAEECTSWCAWRGCVTRYRGIDASGAEGNGPGQPQGQPGATTAGRATTWHELGSGIWSIPTHCIGFDVILWRLPSMRSNSGQF